MSFLENGQEVAYYIPHCVACEIVTNLAMVAHRKDGKMVGWVFACPRCLPTVLGSNISLCFVPGEGCGG